MVAPRELGRPRPGIVVQANDFSAKFSTVFICPTTTDIQMELAIRPLIEASPANGLRLRSQIMTDKMAAIRREQIRSLIGHIDSGTAQQIDRALMLVLGLADKQIP